MKPAKIEDEQVVYYVERNGDLTEGRGPVWLDTPCESRVTATRIGFRKSVQGSDCNVVEGKAYRIEGKWYYRGRLVSPSREDRTEMERQESQERADRNRIEAVAKARGLGLSDEDIAALASRKSR